MRIRAASNKLGKKTKLTIDANAHHIFQICISRWAYLSGARSWITCLAPANDKSRKATNRQRCMSLTSDFSEVTDQEAAHSPTWEIRIYLELHKVHDSEGSECLNFEDCERSELEILETWEVNEDRSDKSWVDRSFKTSSWAVNLESDQHNWKWEKTGVEMCNAQTTSKVSVAPVKFFISGHSGLSKVWFCSGIPAHAPPESREVHSKLVLQYAC